MGKFAFIIGAIVIAGLAYQNYQLQSQNKVLLEKIKTEESQLLKDKETARHIEDKLKQEEEHLKQQLEEKKRQDIQAHQSEVNALSLQLTQESAKLNGYKTHLEQLKTKTVGRDISALQSQIQQDEERLTTLRGRLKEYQGEEGALAKESTTALSIRKNQDKLSMDEMNSQIHSQNSLIKETEKQINYWKKRPHDINQHSKLSDLNRTLEEQHAVLQQLNADKETAQLRSTQKNQELSRQVTQEKENLKDTEGQIKKQIDQTTADLKRLRDSIGKEQSTKSNFDKELHSAQSDFEQQSAKVSKLTQEYNRKRDELEKMRTAVDATSGGTNHGK